MISRSVKWTFVLLTLVFILTTAFSLAVGAETLVVAKSGAQFSSIQSAIDSAEPGNTVQVREGTYQENLSVDKYLTLEGGGASRGKIDGKQEGCPVLHVGASEVEVTVKDLSLQGAESNSSRDTCQDEERGFCPTGLAAVGDSEIKVKGVTISGNWIGIFLKGSSRATVESSKIKENKFGISLEDSTQATVQNNSIRKNNTGIKIYKPENSKASWKVPETG